MPNASVYLTTKRLEILKEVPGSNVSQKLGFVIDAYAEQRGVKVEA